MKSDSENRFDHCPRLWTHDNGLKREHRGEAEVLQLTFAGSDVVSRPKKALTKFMGVNGFDGHVLPESHFCPRMQ